MLWSHTEVALVEATTCVVGCVSWDTLRSSSLEFERERLERENKGEEPQGESGSPPGKQNKGQRVTAGQCSRTRASFSEQIELQ